MCITSHIALYLHHVTKRVWDILVFLGSILPLIHAVVSISTKSSVLQATVLTIFWKRNMDLKKQDRNSINSFNFDVGEDMAKQENNKIMQNKSMFSLEAQMTRFKLSNFGSLEKSIKLRKVEGERKDHQQNGWIQIQCTIERSERQIILEKICLCGR